MMTSVASLTALMVFAVAVATGGGGTFHRPYARSDVDLIYNLLFCDDPQLFIGKDRPTGAVATVPSPTASVTELRRIADDDRIESRVRILAFNRPRAAKAPVPKGTLLGVIIEMLAFNRPRAAKAPVPKGTLLGVIIEMPLEK